MMCCRGGPRDPTLLFQTSTGLGAGASIGGLGELLVVLVLLLPLLLDQLLEIRQVRTDSSFELQLF